MELTIKKEKGGKTNVQIKNSLTKYVAVSLIFYLIVGELWKAWERYAYGEIKPDTFDGIVLIVFSITIGAVLFLIDLLKEIIEAYPEEISEP